MDIFEISEHIYSWGFSFGAFFSSAKIFDGDWSISGITFSDWFIFAKEIRAADEKTQAVYLTRRL